MITYFGKAKSALQLKNSSSIWKQYLKSMNIRREGSSLEHNAFGRYLKKSTILTYKNSFLIGQLKDGAFCVSHYAPSSRREGVELLKHAASLQKKVVFAVTGDIAPMLQKLGFRPAGKCSSWFRGEQVEKHLFIN